MNLIEIFTFEELSDLLKGSILITGDRIQFSSELWEILVVNKSFESRFTINNINSLMYGLDANHNDINPGVLLTFIQYIEERCKQEKIRLRITEELKKAKEDLKKLDSKKITDN